MSLQSAGRVGGRHGHDQRGLCWLQAPSFQEQVVDLLALVLTGMAGPEAPACIAAASEPARAQVRHLVLVTETFPAHVPKMIRWSPHWC